MTTPDETRAEYIAGLRMLADLLEQNPHLILPYSGAGSPILVMPGGDDEKAQTADWARAIPGKVTKDVRDSYFDVVGSLRGVTVKVIAHRDKVCTRVVTGSETVTKTVPDPSVDVPLVEVTETVETVEWVCGPLLAGDES